MGFVVSAFLSSDTVSALPLVVPVFWVTVSAVSPGRLRFSQGSLGFRLLSLAILARTVRLSVLRSLRMAVGTVYC